ncbi:hypothetical protein Nepgr_005894 [Nepenthes gracilis]|uniref:Uncharacterized protein n=1 Tax=Nepenthes gracilis TaxID=150966 RepID=A0AAD3S4C6_NEPGR|nr:hypothetical protein Nepgr_005894 [Nepenthes gracilis]
MELQMELPSLATDFDFNSGRSSPRLSSTPSTPRGFENQFYVSAPTSPARAAEFYGDFEDLPTINTYPTGGADCSASSFRGEESTRPCKLPGGAAEADDFEFAIDGEKSSSLSAEDLFDGGRIRSLMPPSSLQDGEAAPCDNPLSPPFSPRSSKSQGKKRFWSSFLPKKRKDKTQRTEQMRGRERVSGLSASTSGRRGARSLSPVRVSKYPWEEEQLPQKIRQSESNSKTSSSSFTTISMPSSSKGCRRWRLKDFLLFRSASEGRASDKDPFKEYPAFYRKPEDAKNSINRPTDSPSSTVPTSRRRRLPVSAHETHYTLNKAASEDLKKKTFLPYKQGILGRLAINPTVHALANGFGSLTHG